MAFNVVSKTRLRQFWEKHARSQGPLSKWHMAVSHATWTCFDDVRKTYNSADWVQGLVVFDVGAGYRIVADIAFTTSHIYIKHVMTHAEYDAWTAGNR